MQNLQAQVVVARECERQYAVLKKYSQLIVESEVETRLKEVGLLEETRQCTLCLKATRGKSYKQEYEESPGIGTADNMSATPGPAGEQSLPAGDTVELKTKLNMLVKKMEAKIGQDLPIKPGKVVVPTRRIDHQTAEPERQRKQLEEKLARLEAELTSRALALAQRDVLAQEQAQRVSSLEADLAETERKVILLNSDKGEKEKSRRKMETLNETANADLNAQNQVLEAKRLELEARIQKLEAKNQKLEAKYQKLEAKNHESEANNRELGSKNLELEAKCQALQQELAAKQQKVKHELDVAEQLFKKKLKSREKAYERKLQESERNHQQEMKTKVQRHAQELEAKEQAFKQLLEAKELQQLEADKARLEQQLEVKDQKLRELAQQQLESIEITRKECTKTVAAVDQGAVTKLPFCGDCGRQAAALASSMKEVEKWKKRVGRWHHNRH